MRPGRAALCANSSGQANNGGGIAENVGMLSLIMWKEMIGRVEVLVAV